jgi:hypothetical protein
MGGMAGCPTAAAEIPALNGGSLVIQAIQQEEGGVSYEVGRKPADAHDEWSIESSSDPFSTPPVDYARCQARP